MKILIVSDSLALPREHPELCEHHYTWPYLLGQEHEVYQLSMGGATISEIVRQLEYHKLVKADIVIVQSGIVDCAPRALKRIELELINRIPLVSSRIQNLIKKYNYELRKKRKITYTSVKNYGDKVHRIFDLFERSRVFFISILPGREGYDEKVPGVVKNIKLYNSILNKELNKSSLIDISNMPKEGVMSDYIHLNKIGHNYIYELIVEKINA